jgi:hypothetical protein
MTSTGVPASNAPGNEQAREPKGHEVSTGYDPSKGDWLMPDLVYQAIRGYEALGTKSTQIGRHDMAHQ